MARGRRPIITLLTDFGTAGAYVGVMKGVILSQCPTAHIVDLTHDVPAQDVAAAGYLLSTSWPYFPAMTVHVAVVDPGVGTARRILAATAREHFFVAPDNGLLTAVFDEAEPEQMVSVENEKLFRQPVSTTFHGRDIFAPAAAALASGTPLKQLGPTVDAYLHVPISEPVSQTDGSILGQVIYVDSFGNLITNIEQADVPARARIVVGEHTIAGPAANYGSVEPGQLLAVIGSTGRLEIAVNGGSARDLLACGPGTELRLVPRTD